MHRFSSVFVQVTCMHRCRWQRWRWDPRTREAVNQTPRYPGPGSCPEQMSTLIYKAGIPTTV